MPLIMQWLQPVSKWCFLTALYIYTANSFSAPLPQPQHHAISLHGLPKYSASFKHFDYVNPDAPKGGKLKQGVIGHFDTLIPYSDRGTPAIGSYLIYDTLLARSWDEPLTKYGLIAEKIELDPDNNWAAFHVNPNAYFHDGKPVTARDVKFSFDLLREKGSAFYKHFYREVERVEVTGSHRVVFLFNTNKNHELPLILGQLPVLPEHYWKDRNFSSPGLEIPVASGPYQPVEIEPGRTIVYQRNKHYWGANIPANKGRHNFDQIEYEYYRDRNVLQEALYKGQFNLDITHEQLNEDALKKQQLVRTILPNHNPQTLTLTYNTRRPQLKDSRVRQAIGYAVDFNWINEHLFKGMYKRASSYFAGTDMASSGLPSPEENKLLTPWKQSLPEPLFSQPWVTPGDEPGLTPRTRKTKALALLKSAGWTVKQHRQVDTEGNPVTFEILLTTLKQERIMIPVQKALNHLGIQLNLRTVDTAQYVERIRSRDFDLVLHTFPHTPSPGTEQANFWASHTVNQHGTRNLTGAALPALDSLTEKIPATRSRDKLVTTLRAMDRVLLWQHYGLPLWYQPYWSIIHKPSLHHPEHPAPYALDISTWWYKNSH